jgi:ubiquinone/menaquinone biosynthesis C-methylase UbiE
MPQLAVRHEGDVQAFNDRAPVYETGWRGRMHQDIAARAADIALGVAGRPDRVLDVGCGTGLLLHILAQRLPECEEFAGVDPAPGMISVARSLADDSPPALFDWGGGGLALP